MSGRPPRGVSVIVPAWNGTELLRKNLPDAVAACARLRTPWEVLVVDDASTDPLAEAVEGLEGVRIVRREKNGGFGPASRSGAAEAAFSILYFLNSDVRLDEDALAAVVPHFDDEDVFAVASLDAESSPFAVPAVTRRLGLLGVRYLPVIKPEGAVPLLFATGGHAAFDAAKFRELGGFDELFDPFYWEDIDLGVRARARGWKILLEPKSVARHGGAGSVSRKFSAFRIERWRAGHRFLFTLRHGRPSPRAFAALSASHGWAAPCALLEAAARWTRVSPQRRASEPVLRAFSSAQVKASRAVPRTVAFFSPAGEISGGGELSLLVLLKALDRSKFRPVLSCPSDGELARRARECGAEVAVHPLSSTAAGLLGGEVSRLARWLLKEDVDLVHANASGRTLLLPAMAAKTLGLPVVWHARIADSDGLMDAAGRAASDRIIATSAYVAAKFEGYPRLSIVPNAVDAAAFARPAAGTRERLGLGPGDLVAAAMGKLHAWKRFDVAVEAFARARSKEPRLRLLVIGDGPEAEALGALARRLDAASGVVFAGWREDPAPLLASSDMLLHPTPGEHFGRVFIEAMASGLPVVARADGGAAEIVKDGETGLLVRGGAPEAFADALLSLCASPERRRNMGRAGREEALRLYEPAAAARRIEAEYERLLDGAIDGGGH
ncbi:MAG: glycosyltransferase [Elusimicrobia bacterium]|nr:glycosyltransferase [Elusimicrobiota bacterium]